MCGLAGLIHLDGKAADAADAARVRAMCDAIGHRGPDDAGVETVGAACLGSRRLAIQDPSPAGHMPMADTFGRYWIAFNGEVYNFAAVREELRTLGFRFRSGGDTEVVLAAWIQWGVEALARFEGMFAFAIHDRKTDELVLVRDRCGVKPLYWTRVGKTVLFASELKALLPQRPQNKVDRQSLVEWWLYRNIDAITPATLVEDVFTLLPGQLLRVANGRVETSSWFDLHRLVDADAFRRFEAMKLGAIVDEVERTLTRSVELRLVSDVPVGTLLSGGLDSSLITALAARVNPQLQCFHASIAGYGQLDERPHAERVAKQLGLPLHVIEFNREVFRTHLAEVIWYEDLPLTHPNSVAYYCIAAEARRRGVKVLLSGEGADELFGGYRWNYRRRQLLLRLAPVLRLLPGKLLDLVELVTYSRAGLPVTAHGFRDLLPVAIGAIDNWSRVDLVERCADAYAFVGDTVDQQVLGAMLSDLGDFLAPLLRRLDRTMMGAGVECREPFLDRQVIATAVNLPLGFKLGRLADKRVLKDVARRHLPAELVDRRKLGFPLPLTDFLVPFADGAWAEGGFCMEVLGMTRRGIARTIADWRARPAHLVGLLSLELWGRMFIMGESRGEVGQQLARAA